MTINQAQKIRKTVRKRRKTQSSKKEKKLVLIPTGSTLLNLACSDNVKGGYVAGSIVNVIGDKSSGKSILCSTTLAECAYRPEFDNYRLIYDDIEMAYYFDIEKLFGKKTMQRIECPRKNKEGKGISSKSLEDFYANVLMALKKGKPFIYVCDSLDSLHTLEDDDRAKKILKNAQTGTPIKGSWKVEKPKILSEMLRTIMHKLKDTGSLLIIISQTRQNLNPLSFEKKRRSGGDALGFYSVQEIWLTRAGILKDASTKIPIGNQVAVKFTKNKITGKIRNNVEFAVYQDYGIDDLDSCIEFLAANSKDWKKKDRGIFETKAFGELMQGRKKSLISKIEKSNLEEELRRLTAIAWENVEKNLKLERKKRYD